ncbi:MAG: hypothetical protein H7177_08440 [Rhizobacter sp.]|nr:hypothetical protein [Bacteriovorax sp.]
MLKLYKLPIHVVVIVSLFFQSYSTVSYAAEKAKEEEATVAQPVYNLQDMALPSDIKDLAKQGGAIYYSSPSKNKVLMPVHFWGFMQKPGLHFIPTETPFVRALSLTGGPLPGAKLESIYLTRIENGVTHKYEFDVSDGGTEETQKFAIKPGDIVFVPQDRFIENRAYYTSLISIGISILTGILLYREIRKDK